MTNAYTKHGGSSNNLTLHLMEQKKKNEAKVNKSKEIKIGIEISEMETKNRKKIIKTRFFKTINKSLARFTTDE